VSLLTACLDQRYRDRPYQWAMQGAQGQRAGPRLQPPTRPFDSVGTKTSLTGALRDEVIDLRFVEASWINPNLLEEPFDLQADDPVYSGPSKKSD
jgi:hypothetical protein